MAEYTLHCFASRQRVQGRAVRSSRAPTGCRVRRLFQRRDADARYRALNVRASSVSSKRANDPQSAYPTSLRSAFRIGANDETERAILAALLTIQVTSYTDTYGICARSGRAGSRVRPSSASAETLGHS